MKEFHNFLPVSLQHEIHDDLTSNRFPWYWLDDVTSSPAERAEVPNIYASQPGLHHSLMWMVEKVNGLTSSVSSII